MDSSIAGKTYLEYNDFCLFSGGIADDPHKPFIIYTVETVDFSKKVELFHVIPNVGIFIGCQVM